MRRMFSDINSARSDPHGHINTCLPSSTQPNIYFDQENPTQSRYQTPAQSWKNMLLPQIDFKYQEIMRQRDGTSKRIEIDNEKSRASVISKNSKVTPHLTNSTIIDVQSIQNTYEQKIQSLEEQNQSLRQQLFYLREALLINFQTKEKNKDKSPTKKPQ